MYKLINRIREKTSIKKTLYFAIFFAIFSYVFSIPSFSSRGPLKYISYGMVGILLISVLCYSFLYKPIKFDKCFIPLIFFIFFALIGTLIYSKEYRRWITLVLMSLTFFSFYYACSIIDNKRLIIKIVIFAFLLFTLYFCWHHRDKLLHFSLSGMRLGFFDNVNILGFYFSLACIMSLFVAIFPQKMRDIMYLLPAILFFVCGITTGSRSFFIVVVTSVFAIFFVRFRKKIIFLLLTTLLTLALFIALINMLPFLKEQFDRALFTVFGIGNSKIDTSTVQRIVWGQYAFDLGSRNIVFGYGVEGFSIISGLGTYAHNNFFEVMCDFGIIGFLLFYMFLMIPLLKCFRCNDNTTYFTFIIVFAYLIRSFFGVIYYSKDTYFILGICYYLVSHRSFQNVFSLGKVSYSEVSV